jgi:hypothetical protein
LLDDGAFRGWIEDHTQGARRIILPVKYSGKKLEVVAMENPEKRPISKSLDKIIFSPFRKSQPLSSF